MAIVKSPILTANGTPYLSRSSSLEPDFFRPNSVLGRAREDVERRPYSRHSWIYAACTAITQPLAQLPKILSAPNRDGDAQIIKNHEILDVLLDPNPMMDGTNLWEATILGLLLPSLYGPGGSAFWIGLDRIGNMIDWTKGTVPAEIFVYTENTIKPRRDKHGVLNAWVMRAAKEEQEFKLNEVLRFHLYNPYDAALGLSPYAAAEMNVRQDAKADRLNTSFFDNNASLGGTLTTDQALDQEDLDAVESKWATKYTGSDNSGKIAILYKGLKYEQFGRSHVDMQFLQQKHENRDVILAVYRVPKFAVSLYEDLNLATAEVAERMFWRNTLLPMQRRVEFIINNKWLAFTRQRFEIHADLTKIDALQDKYTSEIADMKSLVDMGVPVNVAKKLFGVPLATDDLTHLDTVFVQPNLTDIRAIEANEGVGLQLAPSFSQENGKAVKDPITKSIDNVGDVVVKVEEREKKIERFYNRAVKKVEKDYKVQIRNFMNDQRNTILDNLDEWRKENKAATYLVRLPTIALSSILPNGEEQNSLLMGITEPAFEKEIELVFEDFKEDYDIFGWTPDAKTIKRLKRDRLKTLSRINSTTFDAVGATVKRIVGKAYEENMTVGELTAALKKAINVKYAIRKSQVNTIARTEIGTMASTTRFDIMMNEGMDRHEWAHSMILEGARQNHVTENGNIVRIGDKFPMTGLIHPQENGGPAKEVINCRCLTFPVIEG